MLLLLLLRRRRRRRRRKRTSLENCTAARRRIHAWNGEINIHTIIVSRARAATASETSPAAVSPKA